MKKLLLAVAGLAAILGTAPARADLLVAPTRVDFNERTKGGTVTLTSVAKEKKTYRISWHPLKQREDGSYEVLEEPRTDAKVLHDAVRYTPRQVTLEPGESQTVRLSFKAPDGGLTGEFRSHLLFVAEPAQDSDPAANKGQSAEGVAIDLTMIYGVSIPVVARVGVLENAATISYKETLTQADGRRTAVVDVTRAGTASSFGDVEIYDGAKQIGLLRGVAVFNEINRRTVQVPLDVAPGAKIGGPLKVRYVKPDDGSVISEATAK